VSLGLDVFGGPSYFRGTGPEVGADGYTMAVVSRVGVGGRLGLYAELAAAAITVVGFAILAAALSGTH
jgi:hypothetical protein